MTIETIVDRDPSRYEPTGMDLDGMEVLVPYDAEREKMTPAAVTNIVWLENLRDCLQESVRLGLFGTTTIDRAVDAVFKSANKGWCQGVVDSALVLGSVCTPISTTAKDLFSSPERLFFAQVFYQLEDCLLSRAVSTWALNDLCNRTFRLGPSGPRINLPSSLSPTHRNFLKSVGEAWSDSGFPDPDDEGFMREKGRLMAHYFGRVERRDPFFQQSLLVTGNDGEEALQRLRKKAHLLREEILGGPLPRPALTISRDHSDEWERLWQQSRSKFRCIQVNQADHVSAVFQQHGKTYMLDTSIGLVLIKGEEREKSLFHAALGPKVESVTLYVR